MDIDSLEGTVDAARTCVFTIVSRNYFHFALNLMASVAEHLPGVQRVIVICDDTDGLADEANGIELLAIDALQILHLDRMVVHYTILELNTAIKPFAFAKLFERETLDKVIYFDPDIQLFSSGAPLLQCLASAEVVLTPHLTAPLDDDKHPSDLSILQSGTYNLGFAALRRSTGTQRLLAWWQDKLVRDCVVDIPRGLFTDQKWMDLVPGLFEAVHIERDVGWNVAYWNLPHRHVTLAEHGYRVNDRPLFFFHFSGWNPNSALISKHQDRYRLEQCSLAVRSLFAQYQQRLVQYGRERHALRPYAFATLADGTPLPDCARQLIREQLDWGQPLPNLRSLEGARLLIKWLTTPVDAHVPPLSRLALQVHRARADLQAAFPDVQGLHRQAFVDWFEHCAGPEAGIVGALASVGPRDNELAARRPAAALPAPTSAALVAAPAAATSQPLVAVWPYRLAYRLAWNSRHLLRPLTTLSFRQRVRALLMRRAYALRPSGALPVASTTATSEPLPDAPFGITVVGYVKAESGVGESARAMLRALKQADIPHALADYQVGNVSRMGEAIDERLANGQRHAVSLFHINADQLPLARSFLGEAYFEAPRRIGYWAWELENFPADWHDAFAHVDEVWVPSSFCQRAIGAVSPLPVLTIPHAIEIPEHSAPDRARFGLRPGSVAFLAMADMMSSAERKNPFGAVEAFATAFMDGAVDAELVVKISNPSRDAAAYARLQSLAAGCPGIHLMPDYLDRPALNSLIDSVDCFVSLHRSEGFGLVIAEAMARGKVVVATGWSGNMDFMTAHNSLPVDYQLQALALDVGPYRRGERWAEPCVADAARKMRQVAQDPGLRHTLGQRAREHCLQHLAPAVVGARIAQRLEILRSSLVR